MSTLILRVAGVLLALLGLAAAVVGGWFLANLGTSGTATFTAQPGERVVVLEPDVLNRVDHPVEVTAEARGELWSGTARPSDVEAFIGDGARSQIDTVEVGDWALVSTGIGTAEAPDPSSLDVWHETETGDGTVTRTIEQAQAPQSLVIAAPEGGEIERVTMTVVDGEWGTTALTTLVVGLIVLLLGLALLARSFGLLRRNRSRTAHPTREEASA